MTKAPNSTRADFYYYRRIPTRWADNDVYGHVNNVVYYGYFDTVVNAMLLERDLLDIEKGAVIGLVVETGCRYFAPLVFPQTLDGALRVAKLGNTSIRYELAIFAEGDDAPSAEGHFVHVYVDRETRRPVPLSAEMRSALAPLCVPTR